MWSQTRKYTHRPHSLGAGQTASPLHGQPARQQGNETASKATRQPVRTQASRQGRGKQETHPSPVSLFCHTGNHCVLFYNTFKYIHSPFCKFCLLVQYFILPARLNLTQQTINVNTSRTNHQTKSFYIRLNFAGRQAGMQCQCCVSPLHVWTVQAVLAAAASFTGD